jgi:putative ABC transport system permease protein
MDRFFRTFGTPCACGGEIQLSRLPCVAVLGVAIGLASAFGLTRIIASFLHGVTARDPAVFVAVPLVLSAVALIGVWFPARRAARVDPAIALRAE